MKKRLHDKKAGIAILIALIAISLAEIIYRTAAIGKAVLATSNLGEQLAVIALAATILVLTVKGKDRACYICYGAWIGYFVLDQLFELPGQLITVVSALAQPNAWESAMIIRNIGLIVVPLSYICIVAIGALLVEYMDDGSIYNRAFNGFCAAALVLLTISTVVSVYNIFRGFPADLMLLVFHNLYRGTMVFLFAFFAYDSAKMQLAKTDFTK